MFRFQDTSLMDLLQYFLSHTKVDLCMTQIYIKSFRKYVNIQGRGDTIIYHLPCRNGLLVVSSRGKLSNMYYLVALYYNKNIFLRLVPITGETINPLQKDTVSVGN